MNRPLVAIFFPNREPVHMLKKKGKNRHRILTSLIKRHFKRFHVVVVQWTAKKSTKKRAELLFCSENQLFFDVVVVSVPVVKLPVRYLLFLLLESLIWLFILVK